jgi:hypothetical protein
MNDEMKENIDLPRDPSEIIREAQAKQESKDIPEAIKDALENKIDGDNTEVPEMPGMD